MRKTHVKNTIRYYLIVVLLLVFLFLSGDFGMIDVQKTAIVMAVGIDREADTFIVTSQIAVPQSSKQGKATEAVQIVSRGETVADALEEINAKTGWYPKFVFCRLVILGENAASSNVFDCLDFFLMDEYMPDNCLLAACDGFAKDLLNVQALVDPSGSLAMQKVLSPHAERVGTVLPSTLREFAIGYFSESKSSYMPLLKTQPQQEQVGENKSPSENSQNTQNGSGNGSGSSNSSSSGANGSSNSSSSVGATDKPVFSASETALFYAGKRVGKLSKEETFAYGAVKSKLRLAAYSAKTDDATCTLTVKRNTPKIKFSLTTDGRAVLNINLVMSAGLLDYSQALPLEKSKDGGDVPLGVFNAAQSALERQIFSAFETCRACGCDLFGLTENLQKYHQKRFHELKDNLLKNAVLQTEIRFRNIR